MEGKRPKERGHNGGEKREFREAIDKSKGTICGVSVPKKNWFTTGECTKGQLWWG